MTKSYLLSKKSDTDQQVQRYLDEVYATVVSRNPNETEFHQAVALIFKSLSLF